jgi:hypothetical protein
MRLGGGSRSLEHKVTSQGCRVSAPWCRKKALVAISVAEHCMPTVGVLACDCKPRVPAFPFHFERNDDRTRMANGP